MFENILEKIESTKTLEKHTPFLVLTGSHLYGFAGPSSDYDVKGVHVIPLSEYLGIENTTETRRLRFPTENIEVETHDIKKFLMLMAKGNGNILEIALSNKVIKAVPKSFQYHIQELAKACLTKKVVDHYIGIADSQWKLMMSGNKMKVKSLLYVYRALLTGIHLMSSHDFVIDINELIELFQFDLRNKIKEYIQIKKEAEEMSYLPETELVENKEDYLKLRSLLIDMQDTSSMPNIVSKTTIADINWFIYSIRKAYDSDWSVP